MTESPLWGQTAVVTGASGGIGKVTALALARQGARLVLVCRNAERGAAVAAEIRSAGGAADVVAADLSSLAQVRRAAAEVAGLCPRINLLVNNAGGINPKRTLTVDGFETTFATNHLAYFLLTNLLLERIKASAPARIVNVSSDAHRTAAMIPFDDLKAERSYKAWRAYAESKLANILFTRELARRLQGSGVTVNAVHPGPVATGFGQGMGLLWKVLLSALRPFLLTPEQGADTVIYAASAPELDGVSGRYFAKRKEKAPRPPALDDAAAAKLWAVSEALTGLSA